MATTRIALLNAKRSQNKENVRCQKCLEMGHWTYECSGKRKYVHRPSRISTLNKKLKQKQKEEEEGAKRLENPKSDSSSGDESDETSSGTIDSDSSSTLSSSDDESSDEDSNLSSKGDSDSGSSGTSDSDSDSSEDSVPRKKRKR
ncbi:zinc finger CCHC domain-containing protein 10 [Strongylocentrotus purpuratus]|uniref:Zinc finger CCHC domain-containing protein 10 n=1 Tax=Strongylocentrotus purpuratus TaxID=7668 RepID=A0A7M7RHZ1_STRPU|nr:zinc finger CCHC domain-containing protein 10-like [Strongylocentrotus purpuratus]XP_792574.2 zinc finger CCHC domain-containing protein 10 [Strongylocentrotus purpuratus]|eukprot:XP_792574.2 PREDICTED: zinc finger CCHC domain-containing protein 10 [Strongylocentrotus purpuratus]